MSDDNQNVRTGWSSVQVYTLSAICLLIGVTMGYLFRGSTAPRASAPASVQMQAGNPAVGTEAGGNPAANATPTPEAMKRMADKQVAPLLEQLNKNPKDTETLTKVASYYFAAGQFSEAANYYEKIAELKPTAEVLNKLSNAYYYGGATDKAVDALNRALKIDPKFANALYNLGMLKWQAQGDTKGAIECWERLLKTNPNHPGRAQVEKMIARAKEHAKEPAGTKTDKPAM
jgi:cytochrome c-type biogenesis protein CcmH/NrfG